MIPLSRRTPTAYKCKIRPEKFFVLLLYLQDILKRVTWLIVLMAYTTVIDCIASYCCYYRINIKITLPSTQGAFFQLFHKKALNV